MYTMVVQITEEREKMITYNDYDLDSYSDYIKILEYLGGEEPSEDDVWEIARESERVPNFENILYGIVLCDIVSLACFKYKIDMPLERITYFINARDTHLYFDNEEIYCLESFKELLGETVKEQSR